MWIGGKRDKQRGFLQMTGDGHGVLESHVSSDVGLMIAKLLQFALINHCVPVADVLLE